MPVRLDRTGLATAPRPDAQTVLRERIVLGEIVGAHGLRGEIRVRHAGDEPDHLLASEVVWLERIPNDPESRRRSVLRTGTGRGGEVRLALEGVATREAAQALVGLLVTGSPEQLPELPAGEYYWYELIGCLVESESGEPAGRVREIWETGAHDVLLVEDDRGVRRLIPTAAALMKSVDLEARRIVVVDLPGLFEPV
ncbi:MAG: 16S rRNA processing protein RimM [Spirochaetaceae bacterium]|nr:16S rRNA processing protein RimM [Myxococcales bacterium]MCB9726631.1 16S rRNA processing protein RimM [Spirochaetaceae bacterium]HPG26816.1 ribosome maturation factor RimM [Myxococcota bacterium]